MTEKQSDTKETPIEELQCHKKYVYDTGIIFECKNNCKSEIIGEDVVDLLNELATKCSQLKKENEQLRLQLNLCSDQRNEFHRGARENANRVGKLKKENEQLKHQNELLSDELEQCKAVIDKRWSEYLKKKGLQEND